MLGPGSRSPNRGPPICGGHLVSELRKSGCHQFREQNTRLEVAFCCPTGLGNRNNIAVR
jgi:hypothetical protein